MKNWITEYYQDKFGISLKINQKLFQKKSSFQNIEVYETNYFGKLLLLDGMIMCTEKDEFIYHEMISHVPIMAHPNPKSVLVIGGGDGGTVRELAKHSNLNKIDICEIDADVVETSKKFFPTIASGFDHPLVNLTIGDGIEFVNNCEQGSYDIVIIDSSEPIGPGEGLFTEEFYQNVLQILTLDGILTAQTEAPFLCSSMISNIYQKLGKVFPKVKLYTGPVPTYPSGYWSWTYCSKTVDPFSNIQQKDFHELEKQTLYYNKDIHLACFTLPNFIRRLISSQ